eukprot:TRINITY_DN20_c0_g1_i1.p1 TRINITY_DN20_c0_g1~~TRINITY_DN20_c0_g1_i1.p1  ORF type:complete len:208 (+),score=48.46 TRINITY_DN20_c0_g1_i1:49-672(+)
MSAKPRITYFPVRGRAEIIRLTLAAAGVEWEENPVNPEKLGQLKQSGDAPFGQVPLYHEGDFTLAQSNAIARYIARKHHLYGKDDKEAAIIDMIVDGHIDLTNKVIPLLYPSVNKEGIEKFGKETAPVWAGYFEKLLAKNNGGKGWAVGDKLSLADISLYLLVESYELHGFGGSSSAPLLFGLKDRVAAVPSLAAYIKSEKRYPARS